jgi:hypothetical protein
MYHKSQLQNSGNIIYQRNMICSRYVSVNLYATVTFRNVRCKLHFAHFGIEHTYVQWSNDIQIPANLHKRTAACAIAQQYSSSIVISLCLHSRKEKLDAFQKWYCFKVFTCYKVGRDSADGIATRYGLDSTGIESRRR